MSLDARKQPFFNNSRPACPLRGDWVSFRLVDELGVGSGYGGLPYTLHDSAGQRYEGRLDVDGFAKLEDIYCGPVVLIFDTLYTGVDQLYRRLTARSSYPLPITELQFRAEHTRFATPDGSCTENNPARQPATKFYQVEVRDLVRHVAHLPPIAPRTNQPQRHALKMLAELGFGVPEPTLAGVVLFPNNHTVLEVRPLRALRPALSSEDSFSALNLYQLSLIAALSYCDFGQEPPVKPTDQVHFPQSPSVGNLFAEQLSCTWKPGKLIQNRYSVFTRFMKRCLIRDGLKSFLSIRSCIHKIVPNSVKNRSTPRVCTFLMTKNSVPILKRSLLITTR